MGRARFALLAVGVASALVALMAIRWDAGRLAPRGLLDDDPRPVLHGLPAPASFRIVSRRTSSHGDITLHLRAPRPVDAARVLADVQRSLPDGWKCLAPNTRLGFAGFRDEVACVQGDYELGYRAADWDTQRWERRVVSEMTVTVGTPIPED